MREDFLQYLWKYKNFNTGVLKTTTGETMNIIHQGTHNTNAGPDFLEAKIKIGDTLWAGSIEVHLKSSLWKVHKHDEDSAYKNVILHVVYENDMHTGLIPEIPMLELKPYIPAEALMRYHSLMENLHWIPCEKQVNEVDVLKKNLWTERMAAERLEEKTLLIKNELKETENDWTEVFHRMLFRNFGFHINAEQFYALAQRIPHSLLQKIPADTPALEAVMFGAAGMLNAGYKDEYYLALKKEYSFYATKHSLHFPTPVLWNFLRTRPGNFPTIRIAQLANLYAKSKSLFSVMLEVDSVKELMKIFNATASTYWNNHYVFDEISAATSVKKTGSKSAEVLLINTVVPIRYAYGKIKQDEKHQLTALNILEALRPEKNSITQKWQSLGFDNTNAMQSQGLLHLRKHYCANKKCLNCSIGINILSAKK